jgi:ABC-type lipoprotein export system ATPase subunit
MANHQIGSVWRKWDLHVHTPASVVQGYGGDSDDVWDRFINHLEALPDEFAVLGINDYLFIDGYRKLRQLKMEGRLANIETLLPVIEFRLSKFAGHDKMLRLNYHIIFADDLDPDIIEQQFLVQLRSGLNVSAEHTTIAKQWNAVVTKTSLQGLGRLIREDMPAGRATDIRESDFILGFNNLNFDETKLVQLLENSYLRGRYVTAIGKAEWDQYRWTDHSIADKKNFINSVDIVFTAATDLAAFERGRKRLETEKVNCKLFDCSDAHLYADSENKDRLGNCMTWVKGDTTLDGLMLAVKDYPERVYVGPRPPLLGEIDRKPAKYIRRVFINKNQVASSQGKWFENIDIPLNPELVAVIGNRGMGKSALLDSIALAGNAPRPSNEMSFLSQFQKARANLATNFEVTLEWYTPGPEDIVPLSASYDASSPSRVRHLPQHFIDQICNEEHDRFVTEIERVVFSHVPEEERLGLESLSQLVEFRMEATRQQTEDIRTEISELNSLIADLEADLSPARRLQLTSLLDQRLDELRGMWSRRPTLLPLPKSSNPELDARIRELRVEIKRLSAEKADYERQAVTLRAAVESARRVLALLDKIDKDVSKLSADHSEDFSRLGIPIDQIIFLKINRDIVLAKEREMVQELGRFRVALDGDQEGSLAANLTHLQAELKAAEDALSAPMQLYQGAKQAHSEFRQAVREVIGSTDSLDTIRYLKAHIARLESDAPAELVALESVRLDITKALFDKLVEHIVLLHELYAPVQKFIDAHPPADQAFKVEFTASLEAIDFADGLFSHVANNKRGSFYGAEQASARAVELLADTNFSSWNSVAEFLSKVHDALHYDSRQGEDGAARQVSDQVRPGSSTAALYDFIYQLGYIEYRHHLTMGGRSLGDLSPGEKGALLLVFYLLVDRSDYPLLIDQPEENLDNQSVFKVLVPFIKEARRRRQVFLVTHNPNIAVVAGAEQVVFCEMDKSDGYRLSYESGALESPAMNKHVLDVLEGTRPAFASRDETYRVSEEPRRSK